MNVKPKPAPTQTKPLGRLEGPAQPVEKDPAQKKAAIQAAAESAAALATARNQKPSQRILRTAHGAKRVAAIVDAFAQASGGRETRPSAPGEGAGSRKLVQLGVRTGKNLRPSPGKGSSRAARSPLSPIVVKNPAGVPIQVIKRFASSAEQEHTAAPIAIGHKTGPTHMETEYTDKRGNVVRAVGHVLLDTVSTHTSVMSTDIGKRLGYYLVAPACIGGRLAVLSSTFQQHLCRHLRVEYEPTVPSTEPGAIAMYFLQDVESPQLTTGIDELRHASTHDYFVQTSVWQSASLAAKPSDLNRRYASDLAGDTLDETQGALVVETAAQLADEKTYGNLYLHYDFEFYAGGLQYQDGEVPQFSCRLRVNYNAMSSLSSQFASGACALLSGPNQTRLEMATSALPSSDYVLVATVIAADYSLPANAIPSWNFSVSAAARQFEPGQVFYIGFNNPAASTVFDDASISFALMATAPGNADNGLLRFLDNAVATPVDVTVDFMVRAIPIDY